VITKAQLLERAREQDLRPPTVEKDYVLGWMLAAISQHSRLSQWVFKGGTCLKKCFFETYRFSEDLDFTVPSESDLLREGIETSLAEAGGWVEEVSGISFPAEKIKVEQFANPRGREAYRAKVAYACRLNLSPNSLQRIKFDITQDELLVDAPDLRAVSHPYEDAQNRAPRVRCYSVNEILAEKTRALYERQGRARDVYDIVHLSRSFRDFITPTKASAILGSEFEFKGLPTPTVELIVGRVDEDTLRANWGHQLDHQLPKLPPVGGFLSDLRDALAWWLEPEQARQRLRAAPGGAGEKVIPQQHLPTARRRGPGLALPDVATAGGMGRIDKIRYAARNRLCAEIRYDGVARIVEPYSLRDSTTGNTLLYAYELLRDARQSGRIKAFKAGEIQAAAITNRAFKARYRVEL